MMLQGKIFAVEVEANIDQPPVLLNVGGGENNCIGFKN